MDNKIYMSYVHFHIQKHNFHPIWLNSLSQKVLDSSSFHLMENFASPDLNSSLFWLKLFFLKPIDTTLKRPVNVNTHLKHKSEWHLISLHYLYFFLDLEKFVLASTASICKRHLEHLPHPPFPSPSKVNLIVSSKPFFSIGPKLGYHLGPLRTLALFPLLFCSETSESGLVVNLKGAN